MSAFWHQKGISCGQHDCAKLPRTCFSYRLQQLRRYISHKMSHVGKLRGSDTERASSDPISYSPRSSSASPGCGQSLPMGDTPVTNSGKSCAGTANGLSKAKSGPIRPRASWFSPVAGLSSARWHGTTGIVASPKTSNRPSPRQPHGCSSPRSGSSPAVSQDCDNQTNIYNSDS